MVDPKYVITALIGLVVLLAWVVLSGRARFGSDCPTFAIVGPVGSGKTVLFELLTNHSLPVGTVMSQVPTIDTEYTLSSAPGAFTLIDYPGHPKLQQLYLHTDLRDAAFVRKLKGIMFVVDSAAFTKEYCELVARQMLDIFKATEARPDGVDMAVCCNRCDLFTSKKPARIRTMLEEEIEVQRRLEAKSLGKVSDGVEELDDLIGSQRAFTFSSLEGNVDFVEGNAYKENVAKWEGWVAERAVN